MKKILWVLVSCLMALSLVIASCGTKEEPAGETEEPTGETEEPIEQQTEKPEYGGDIVLSWNVGEPDFDLINWFSTAPQHLAHQGFWEGDWTKGPAGGYGTNEVTWEDNTNVPDLNVGAILESWEWTVNSADDTVTTKVIVRDNIYFAEPDSEAGRLVGGRKMTTEDVQWCWQQHISNENSDNYISFPECRDFVVEKTGPQELSITMPFKLHLDALMRYFSYVLIFPPELWDEYGYESCIDITKSVGTGPYYISDYVPSNMVELTKNDNYWRTNPIGPGEGDKLPYADSVKYIIMPDASTRQAALRTAQIDMMALIAWEDAEYLETQNNKLVKAQRGSGQVSSAFFRMDQAPFDDVRVRQAMLYGIDLNEINETLYNGLGDLISFPYFYTPAYADLYLGLDDPEMPADVKDMYTFNPEKAKALLTEAGYPDGFTTDITMSSQEQVTVDYYSIAKEYWSQIGVDVNIKTVTDNGQLIGVNAGLGFDGMIAQFISPVSTFPEQAQYTGDSWLNPSRVSDPVVIEGAEEIRAAGVTSLTEAMKKTKELTKYMLAQVYAIPAPRYPNYCMWWPWLKNYTGEVNVGYMVADTWVQFVWIDQALKKSMGY